MSLGAWAVECLRPARQSSDIGRGKCTWYRHTSIDTRDVSICVRLGAFVLPTGNLLFGPLISSGYNPVRR